MESVAKNMLSVAKSDVPEYLHSTALYLALDDGDGSLISLLPSQLKCDLKLASFDDLRTLVTTLHFWGAESVPRELINFVLDPCFREDVNQLYNAFPEFEFLHTLANIKSAREEDKVRESLKGRCLEITKFLREEGREVPHDALGVAARAGSLVSLKYVRDHWSEAFRGVLTIVEHIFFFCEFRSPAPWSERTCRAAVEGGHLDCLNYMHENGCKWHASELLTVAAANGHLACLNYLFEHDAPWSEEVCTAAAKAGHLACLEKALAQRPASVEEAPLLKTTNLAAVTAGHTSCITLAGGVVLDASLGVFAARRGDLHCLQYLHSRGCPWDPAACTEAAARGHIDCLLYAREQGCPWHQRDVCRAAAESGSLECLQLAFHRRFYDDLNLCRLAAASGSLQCLQFLHERGCAWDSEVCAEAAKYGHALCLEYAREASCRWDRRVCIHAARFGHLPCLVYAHERGCPWDAFVASQAALHGNLHCLQYLHERGCPWDQDACVRAAEVGHLDCLVYLVENGCQYQASVVIRAAQEHGHANCVEFLSKNEK